MNENDRLPAPTPAAARAPHGRAGHEPPAYAPPRLVVFGDVGRLTTRVGSKGKKDGGGNRRTGF